MEQIIATLKSKVWQIDGFTITVGMVIAALLVYWLYLRPRMR